MILGKLIGKINTTNFDFEVIGNAKKMQYCQVYHPDHEYVLCQVTEIERNEKTIAKCVVIGYKDKSGKIKQLRTPFEQGQEVLRAEDDFISSIIQTNKNKYSAYMGKVEGRDINVYIDLNKVLSKHISILAKTGSGKSYAAGVMIEEIMEKKIPILIIDPHGEYNNIKEKNLDDKVLLEKFGLKPKCYDNVVEFGDPGVKQGVKPLRLNENMSTNELLHIIPTKLSPAQMNVIYSSLKNLDRLSFDSLLFYLEQEENNAKFSVINIIDYLTRLGIFSMNPTPTNEMVKFGQCTILNLKGVDPAIQEIFVYSVLSMLFEERKKGKVPPFFAVIEEAHTFCPERSFGETKASRILRTIASEGRKFGMGLCVISQRPARIDKSILSQCSTQIILKVTNPNDLKAISNSVEGITGDSEKEIMNLSIGTAMITGVTDVPLFVRIRPRMTKHGGDTIDMLEDLSDDSFMEKKDEFGEREMLPVIKPKLSKKDLRLMSEKPIRKILTKILPAVMVLCESKKGEFNLLFNLVDGTLLFNDISYKIPDLDNLNKEELATIKEIFKKKGIVHNDVKDKKLMKNLEKKELVIFENNIFTLNPDYIFSDLSTKKTLKEISYLNVDYDKKIKPKFQNENIIDKVSRFSKVKDTQNCYIVKYEVFYE